MTSSLAIAAVDEQRVDQCFECLKLVDFIVSKIRVFDQTQDHLQLLIGNVFFSEILVVPVELTQTLIAKLKDGSIVVFSAEIHNLSAAQ